MKSDGTRHPKGSGASRREVLKLAGTSVPVAAAGLVLGETDAEAADRAAGRGLRSTEHTRKYMASARF